MMITERNLIQARYMNDARDVIDCAVSNENGTVSSIRVIVDPDQAYFQQLMRVCSLEEIDSWTETYYQNVRDNILDLHTRLIEEGKSSYIRASGPEDNASIIAELGKFLFTYDATNADHIEKLFNLKLEMFELDSVINSDEDTKARLRTAATPMEAIIVLHGIMQ